MADVENNSNKKIHFIITQSHVFYCYTLYTSFLMLQKILIDDGLKPNWGTGSQNLEINWKIILSHDPYSVPFSVFEAEISRAEILQV